MLESKVSGALCLGQKCQAPCAWDKSVGRAVLGTKVSGMLCSGQKCQARCAWDKSVRRAVLGTKVSGVLCLGQKCQTPVQRLPACRLLVVLEKRCTPLLARRARQGIWPPSQFQAVLQCLCEGLRNPAPNAGVNASTARCYQWRGCSICPRA